MIRWNTFMKRNKYPLPERYAGLISADDYDLLIELTISFHSENGFTITEIDDGGIVLAGENGEGVRYLDNLVRALHPVGRALWEELVYKHFNALKSNEAAIKYLHKDYDYACQFLRVLLKSNEQWDGDFVNDYIHREDFPNVYSFVVLEFEEQFHYLKYEDVKEWEQSEEILFKKAIENTPLNEIEVEQFFCSDTYPIYMFTSGDYAASLMLDIENRYEQLIGTYGALIAIPSKTIALVHPIEKAGLEDLIADLYLLVRDFYEKEPGNITLNFYWLYKNQIEVFSFVPDVYTIAATLPENLRKMLNLNRDF